MARQFRLVYVFEPRDAEGYVARLPVFLARLVCRVHGGWDYAPTPAGLVAMRP